MLHPKGAGDGRTCVYRLPRLDTDCGDDAEAEGMQVFKALSNTIGNEFLLPSNVIYRYIEIYFVGVDTGDRT